MTNMQTIQVCYLQEQSVEPFPTEKRTPKALSYEFFICIKLVRVTKQSQRVQVFISSQLDKLCVNRSNLGLWLVSLDMGAQPRLLQRLNTESSIRIKTLRETTKILKELMEPCNNFSNKSAIHKTLYRQDVRGRTPWRKPVFSKQNIGKLQTCIRGHNSRTLLGKCSVDCRL